MKTDLLTVAAALSDADLLGRLTVLAEQERGATVELVAHLAELERRRIYLAEGYGSLFNYCTGALRLSEHVAYNCLEAARAARKFPEVLDLLVTGAMNLTTLRILGPYLTPENQEAVLAEAAGHNKRATEMIVARLAPLPDVPSFLRKLPMSPSGRSLAASSVTGRGAGSPVGPTDANTCDPITPASANAAAANSSANDQASQFLPPVAAFRTAHPIVAPLAPERFRVQFTVGKETHEKLRFAQDMLRREIPDGDPGAIFDRALTLLLDEVARKKMAATAAPGPDRITAPGSRHIPAAVKRAVWFRDRGQCAFVSEQGRRCKERSFLELHHIQPFALGGEGTTANIALRCRGHNAHESEVLFGPWGAPAVHEARASYAGVRARSSFQLRSAPISATSSLASTS
jgi:hypothetical protein